MAERIVVDPERLRQTAGNMETQRDQAVEAMTSMINAIDNLGSVWQGAARNDYINTFQETVPPQRDQLSQMIEELVNALRNIATQFEQVDEGVA